MYKHCGSIVEKSRVSIKGIIEALSFKVFAEEVPNDDNKGGEGDNKPSNVTINYEDLIAKARKEEKDKQYKAIEKLKQQVATLTEQHNNDLLKIADLESQLKQANEKLTASNKGDSEEVATLKKEIADLNTAKKELEDKVTAFEANKPVSREEVEAQVREELEAEYEVKNYKVTQLAEHKDDILVPELVFGSTKEEIDASIQKALERSAEIKKTLGIGSKPTKRTPKSPTNPSVSKVQDNDISLEYLASLDVSSPEYLEVRKKLGLR